MRDKPSVYYTKALFNRNGFRRWSRFYDTYLRKPAEDILGYTSYKNTQASLKAQLDYEDYLRRANERALADWHRNLPGREIVYPEFSYSGQIRRGDTSIARAGFDYDTARANYYGNLPYRGAGLYGIASRLSRTL